MSAHVAEPLIDVIGLSKRFEARGGIVNAVQDVSFSIGRGRIVGLVGESGCGKTTVGRSLLRLIEPSAGKAIFSGVDIFSLSPAELRAYRKDLQIIFQDPYSSLNPRMRVQDIIGEAVDVAGTFSRGERRDRILKLLSDVGLSEEHARRYPNEFSGGQRQRIGIARALAVGPKFIVADEPVSALDVSVQAQILNLIQDLQAEYGLTILFISHDLTVVEYLCDDIIVMYLGRVMEAGPARRVHANPRHPYTRALMSASPIPDRRQKRDRIVLNGDIPSPMSPPSGCVFRTRCLHATPACAEQVPAKEDLGGGHTVACIRHAEISGSTP
jgi:oligopeptide/dipeptide ABC transporter ATP-binding protein